MKNLFIGLLSVLVIFGGMFYLVIDTVSVGAEKEIEKDYTIIFESIVERDFNRESRAILRKERQDCIDIKGNEIKELEKRADELNTIINGEEGLN